LSARLRKNKGVSCRASASENEKKQARKLGSQSEGKKHSEKTKMTHRTDGPSNGSLHRQDVSMGRRTRQTLQQRHHNPPKMGTRSVKEQRKRGIVGPMKTLPKENRRPPASLQTSLGCNGTVKDGGGKRFQRCGGWIIDGRRPIQVPGQKSEDGG